MRMFQSSSRHSSEQSTAHNSSRPAASQLKGFSDTISNWFENHRPQGTQISTVTNAPFRSKLESNVLQVDHNSKFPERIFQLLHYSRQHQSLSAHWANLMTKTDSTFPAFSFRIVDFAVQFFLHCKFSFREKRRHSNQVWQWHDFPKPITILWQHIATNRIASFCIDHRWRQMAFFVFVKMGKALLSRALHEIKQVLWEQSLILYHIKQIDSTLPCISFHIWLCYIWRNNMRGNQPREVWRGKNPTLPGLLHSPWSLVIQESTGCKPNLPVCLEVNTSILAHNWHILG